MKARLLVSAVVTAASAALVAASPAPAGVTTLHLTAKAKGRSFHVKTDSAVVITLKSCGDCGDEWKLEESSGVQLVSHKYVQHHKGGVLGGTGKEIWRFEVVGPMVHGRIKLRYVLPGGKTGSRFAVRLKISD